MNIPEEAGKLSNTIRMFLKTWRDLFDNEKTQEVNKKRVRLISVSLVCAHIVLVWFVLKLFWFVITSC